MRWAPQSTMWQNWKAFFSGPSSTKTLLVRTSTTVVSIRGGHQTYGKVELIVHNSHAWSKYLHFPQSREVCIFDGDVWQAIREATQGEPLAVWLVGGQDRWLSVNQLVLQDGRIYRTWEAHEGLQAICAKLGDPVLGDRAFRENHATSIMAKEKNAWKPTFFQTSRRASWSTVTAGSGIQ